MIEQVAAVSPLRHIYLGPRVEFAFSIICFIFRTSAMNRCCFVLCILLLLARNLEAQPNGKIQKSLVRITATEVEPDYRAPWNSGAIQRGIGAGFVIDSSRIMTNAHVVSNNRYLSVEREGDPNKYQAKVLFVAHDCDLAVIGVSSPDFFKNMTPLTFGGIPQLESTVSAYGYPIGGERMSVTTGIVSRIDFQLYTHSSIDQHLAIQISAQINPGNSGGPVMQNGKVVGVAFQGYSGDVAQGVAYMIP
ncbi:MAG: serine protease, partial [Verrucomicrobiota bacterium]|nr:serine protease [Verrucomicrobiota bacterium]